MKCLFQIKKFEPQEEFNAILSSMRQDSINTKTLFIWLAVGITSIFIAFGVSSFYTINIVLKKTGFKDLHFPDEGDVAIVAIDKVITDSKKTIEKLNELEEKKSVKAIVVRIDSPGGAVGASQEIYSKLNQIRGKKALVCSMGNVAASGGYYIASACEKIFANPGTLTGSIGVIMHFLNVKDLYQWAKMEPIVLKAGKFKDAGSPYRSMQSDERELLQKILEQIHEQFKNDITKGRSNITEETMNLYADGRIFTGFQALDYGFVDVLGGENDAIEAAATMAGIKGKPKVVRANNSERLSSFLRNEWSLNFLISRLLKQSVNNFTLEPGTPYFLPEHYMSFVR